MKKKYLLFVLLMANLVYCQNFKMEFDENVDVLNIEELKTFSYFKAIKKNSIKPGQIFSAENLNIKNNRAIEIDRIIKISKKNVYFPVFYAPDSVNDTIIVDKYNFIDLSKNLSIEDKENVLLFEDIKITSKGKYSIYKRTHQNIKVIYMKMTIGYYNKYTNCMNLTGNYDDTINVIFLYYGNE